MKHIYAENASVRSDFFMIFFAKISFFDDFLLKNRKNRLYKNFIQQLLFRVNQPFFF